jgi:hypothetical protein
MVISMEIQQAMTPTQLLGRLRQAVPLAQVLHHYGLLTTLKRRGKLLVGPCPFNGMNSSTTEEALIVDPVSSRWWCAEACLLGGDIFDFVARKESVSRCRAAVVILNEFKPIIVSESDIDDDVF